MAVAAVVVAFRTGTRVTDVAQRLEALNASDASWSTIVAGSDSSKIVSSMCKDMVRSLASRVGGLVSCLLIQW